MRPSLAAVASGLLLASALFPLPRASANKYMVMGESLELLLADMLLSGDISSAQQSQIHVFLLRGDSVAEISTPGSEPRGHAATGLPAMTISDTSDLRSYLDSELESGSLGSAAAEYLHALLNLDADVAGLPTSPVVTLHNQYAGNGNVELLGRIDINPPQNGDLYNGIWGYNSESREYAFQCHSDGLYILDVTDPAAAYGVQFIPMPGGRTWRDVDVHTHSGTGVPYAYVAAQSSGNFWVVNLSAISGNTVHGENSNPIPSSDYVDRGRTNYGHTLTVGNGLLFLNTAGSYQGCQIFDLEENPWNPPLVSSWSGSGRDCHDSMVKTVNGQELLFSADGYSRRYRIADLSGVRGGGSPQLIGETPSYGGVYAHQNFVSEDSKYLYTFDEFNVYDIGVYNISDLTNPTLVTTFQWSGEAGGENSIVHNGQVRGNYLLVAYYQAGFRVFDISNPANPAEVGHYETYRDPDGDGVFDNVVNGEYEGAWNLYSFSQSGNVLVSDLNHGTFILRVNPINVPSVPGPISAEAVGSDSVLIVWSAEAERATGYTVTRAADGESTVVLATNVFGGEGGGTTTTYTDENLSPGTYSYSVVATNAEGASNGAADVMITVGSTTSTTTSTGTTTAATTTTTGTTTTAATTTTTTTAATTTTTGTTTTAATTTTTTTTTGGNCNGQSEFTLNLTTDQNGHEISWELQDAGLGGQMIEGRPSATYGPSQTYTESFCIPDSVAGGDDGRCYLFVITDEGFDGLCCDHGIGGYKVTLEGDLFAETYFFKGKSQMITFGHPPCLFRVESVFESVFE